MHTSRWLAPGLLIAAAIISAACGSTGFDTGGSSGGSSGANAPSTGASNGGGPETAVSDAAGVPGLKVIENSNISLSIANVVESYSRVADTTRGMGGYVARAEVMEKASGPAANVSLRVPSSRHGELLTSIKGLAGARVDSESLTSKEVSGEYTDLESRIRNLERTEAQFQQFLTQAKTIDEVLNVSSRLQSTRDEIERARGRLNLYDAQVEYASVDVQMATLVAVAPPFESKAWTPVRVLSEGWDASVSMMALLLNLAAASVFVFAWLVALTVAALVGLRIYRRVAPKVERLLR